MYYTSGNYRAGFLCMYHALLDHSKIFYTPYSNILLNNRMGPSLHIWSILLFRWKQCKWIKIVISRLFLYSATNEHIDGNCLLRQLNVNKFKIQDIVRNFFGMQIKLWISYRVIFYLSNKRKYIFYWYCLNRNRVSTTEQSRVINA